VTSLYSLPYGTYGGFLFRDGGDLIPMRDALAAALSPAQGMTELVDYPGTLPDLPGFLAERRMCHVLDLRGGYEEVSASRYDRSQRKTQRSTRSRGLDVREIESGEDLKAFYGLYEATYGRKGSDVFPLEFLEFMQKTLGSNIFRGYLAFHGETPVAGTVSLFGSNVTVGFLQGSSAEHRDLRAVNLLIDVSIRDAIERGGRAYNLGVTPEGATGVIRFKESFGAVRRDFTVHVKRELLYRLKSKIRG
jgi:hypothetical protein